MDGGMSEILSAEQKGFVSELVRSGRCESEDAVLHEGVRLMQEREARLAESDAKIARGYEDVKAGRTRDMDEVFDELEVRFQAKADAEQRR